MRKKVIVLGATGSVGSNALSVIREYRDEFEVVGLVAGRSWDKLAVLGAEFPNAALALGHSRDAGDTVRLRKGPKRSGKVYEGHDGALKLVQETEADICIAAVSGTAGLELTFMAARKEMRILLANKEVLVSAGRLFMDAVKAGGSVVYPIDSEHAALWQCLEYRKIEDVRKLIITASGGPFREWTIEQMAAAKPVNALRHPVWNMGAKISVDSATLANKALELIEAHHLFGVPYDAMEIFVHPQSIVHGIVEFIDGSQLANIGVCDMRHPIAYMLFYPNRRRTRLPRMDLSQIAKLEFERPSYDKFPLLSIGMEAGRRGGKHPAIFNAANETAVNLFLDGHLSFPGIAKVVDMIMAGSESGEFANLDEVLEAHERVKRRVREYADRM